MLFIGSTLPLWFTPLKRSPPPKMPPVLLSLSLTTKTRAELSSTCQVRLRARGLSGSTDSCTPEACKVVTPGSDAELDSNPKRGVPSTVTAGIWTVLKTPPSASRRVYVATPVPRCIAHLCPSCSMDTSCLGSSSIASVAGSVFKKVSALLASGGGVVACAPPPPRTVRAIFPACSQVCPCTILRAPCKILGGVKTANLSPLAICFPTVKSTLDTLSCAYARSGSSVNEGSGSTSRDWICFKALQFSGSLHSSA
mmetsp:Transcript_21665/g.41359  ORF Transcript_21665/g.41359 Transcript_21665/m.41359 type:complete len:254 (-) Transcript_21665:355-1116(-)